MAQDAGPDASAGGTATLEAMPTNPRYHVKGWESGLGCDQERVGREIELGRIVSSGDANAAKVS